MGMGDAINVISPKKFCFVLFCFVFVSPELSLGRDLVIQMSVRRAMCAVHRSPSAVRVFFVRSKSREPYDLP